MCKLLLRLAVLGIAYWCFASSNTVLAGNRCHPDCALAGDGYYCCGDCETFSGGWYCTGCCQLGG